MECSSIALKKPTGVLFFVTSSSALSRHRRVCVATQAESSSGSSGSVPGMFLGTGTQTKTS
jgi:hypothetical protein